MASKSFAMNLPTLDDIFSTQEERDLKAMTAGRVLEVPLDQIDDFPDHPFHVRLDEDMDLLVESIKENGLLTPVKLRRKEDGRYEIISGHRRRKACELAGRDTLTAEVLEVDRDTAVIMMVDSNLQRSNILPSEKAKSYKMKMDAIKRKAGRPPTQNCSQVETNLPKDRTAQLIAEESGESKAQIFRYIRLNELTPSLLQMVDDRKIAFTPAVELTYLTAEQQQTLCESIESQACTPSLSQAQKMKRFAQEGKLDANVIESIMAEEKPNQREKISVPMARLQGVIPRDLSPAKAQDYIVRAVTYYAQHLARQDIDSER